MNASERDREFVDTYCDQNPSGLVGGIDRLASIGGFKVTDTDDIGLSDLLMVARLRLDLAAALRDWF